LELEFLVLSLRQDQESKTKGTGGRLVQLEGSAAIASSRFFFLLLGEKEMGETTVMAGYGLDKAARCSVSFDTPCGSLLRELEVRFSARPSGLCSRHP
jgi:hypothetical protein